MVEVDDLHQGPSVVDMWEEPHVNDAFEPGRGPAVRVDACLVASSGRLDGLTLGCNGNAVVTAHAREANRGTVEPWRSLHFEPAGRGAAW